MSAERDRVGGVRQAGGRAAPGRRLVPVGAVRQRAPVGHGPRGLQRRRRGVGLPAPRPRQVAGLPLGRGRHGRVLRHRAAAVPGAGAVERARPDPEGADVRADRRAGQPRRGRQGVLVVPGRRPEPCLEPVALPLPAGGLPVRGPHRGEPRRGTGSSPSTSCSTPARSTTTGTGSSRSTTPRPDPTDLLMAVSVTNAGPGHRDPARAAHGVVPQHLVVGPRRRSAALELTADGQAAVRIEHPFLGDLELIAGRRPRRVRADGAVLRERDQRGAAVRGRAAHAVPEGRHQRPRGRRRGHGQPGPTGTKCAFWYQVARRPGGHRRAAAAAAAGQGRRSRRADGRGARQRRSTR